MITVPRTTVSIAADGTATAKGTASTTTGGRKPRPRREHRCSTCHQVFRRAEHLKRHIRRHTLERPFRCRQCLMSFSRNESHATHQKTHHGHSSSTLPPPEIVPSWGENAPGPAPAGHPLNTTAQTDLERGGTPTSSLNNMEAMQLDQTGLNNSNQRVRSPEYGIAPQRTPANSAQGSVIATANQDAAVTPGHDYHGVASDNSMRTSLAAVQVLDLAFDNSFRDGYHQDLLYRPSTNQNTFRYSPTQINTLPEDEIWLSLQNSVNAPKPPAPYPFFTTGLENPLPSAVSTIQPRAIEDSFLANIWSDKSHAMLLGVVQQIYSNSQWSIDSQNQPTLPTTAVLHRYWKTYWEIPNKNLSFLHPSTSTVESTPPALILAVLADGAMYCGDKHVAMAFFEWSRRLVSQYLGTLEGQLSYIPLWVLQTLLINAVYGLPGGDAPCTDTTTGNFKSLLTLAGRVKPCSYPSSELPSATLDNDWAHFIQIESHKRSLLCVLIVVRLWAALYGYVQGNILAFQSNLKMPAAEELWTATSASQWSELNRKLNLGPLRDFENVAESLFDGNGLTRCTGLASICQIVGLLMYIDEVTSASSMTTSELIDHVEPAIETWTRSLLRRRQKDISTLLSVNTAAYARVSLLVDLPTAMQLFLRQDFAAMRASLRRGDLLKAAQHGLIGVAPWAITEKNQISMTPIPCAIVVLEAALVLNNAAAPVAVLRQLMETSEGSSETPVAFWNMLHQIITSGPVTAVLISAMDGYSKELQNLQPFRQESLGR